MNSRYDVIGPNTLEAIRRDSEIIRLKTRIEKLEAALKRYETVYRVSRVYPHEMPDGEVFGVPSVTDGKRIFPLLSDEYDLYVARTSLEGKRNG